MTPEERARIEGEIEGIHFCLAEIPMNQRAIADRWCEAVAELRRLLAEGGGHMTDLVHKTLSIEIAYRTDLDTIADLMAQITHEVAKTLKLQGGEPQDFWRQLADAVATTEHYVVGCGDGGCRFVRPVGTHTNGGCRCELTRNGKRVPFGADALANLYRAAKRLTEATCPSAK